MNPDGLIDSLSLLLGGLGLFFTGVRGLTANMVQVCGRPLRRAIKAHSSNPLLLALAGTSAGMLLQSANGITYILAGMVTAGLLPIANGLPLLLWANLGTSVPVAISALDFRLAALTVLGIVGLWMYVDRGTGTARRQVLEVFHSLGLLFLGLALLRAGTSGMQGGGGDSPLVHLAASSGWVSFLFGSVATLFTQSSSATAIIAVAARQAGLLPPDAAVLLILGASLGAGASVLVMSGRTRGLQRQVVVFQALSKLIGVLIMLPMVLIHGPAGRSLLVGSVELMAHGVGGQLALVYVACQGASVVGYLALARPIRRFLNAIAPPLDHESLGRPEFIGTQSAEDTDLALILAEKEQARLAARLAPALEQPDESATQVALRLAGDIAGFLGGVAAGGEAALSREQLDALANLQSRNEVLRSLIETVHQIALARNKMPAGPAAALADSLSQGLGAVLMCMDDACRAGGGEEAMLLRQISSDRSTMVDALRRRLVRSGNPELVYNLTSLFERAVWLVQRFAILLGAAEMAEEAANA